MAAARIESGVPEILRSGRFNSKAPEIVKKALELGESGLDPYEVMDEIRRLFPDEVKRPL